MTFTQYQTAAAQFAIYPGHMLGDLNYLHPGLQYVILGLIEETGEVAGVVKKCMRDGDRGYTLAVRDKMLKELGDVLWYYTRLQAHLGLTEDDGVQPSEVTKQYPQTVTPKMQRAVVELGICVRDIWLTVEKDSPTQDNKTAQIVAASNFLCAWVRVVQAFGLSAVEIMRANIEKLASRQLRNVLSGSGDDR